MRLLLSISTNNIRSKAQFSSSAILYRKNLILLGTGWGCYSLLKNINKKLYDVIVVSPRNHFLFTPLLNSTTVGTLEFRSIIEPIRNTKFRDDHHFQLAEAIHLKPDEKSVVCKGVSSDKEYTLSYDKIVIGVGAVSNTFGIPGVLEHAYFLKEIADARKIRNRIISNFEQSLYPYVSQEEKKSLLHFIIVGGGPTGVEFGAELYDFITHDVARLFPDEKNDVHVTLVEGDSILPSFDQRLRKFAEKKILQRKNFRLIKDFVVEVGENYVKLKSGEILSSKLVVWSTGLGPRKFIENLNLPKGKSKQLKVDDHLRVVGYDSILAIGDCSYIDSAPLPSTAQVAERQGRYVAEYLSLIEKNPQTDIKPFIWSNAGMLAYIGGYKAIADLPTKAGKLTGFKSWLIWRSVYLTRLGSWRNRMQVPFDWARTFFFGRDISRF